VELEELSYNEAAQVAGCTPKAIETRLYRARELLRQKLKRILEK
jgi:RNA polymerase sigma-70 factor (ECF subfamily)